MFRKSLIVLFAAQVGSQAQAKFFDFQTKLLQPLAFESMKIGKDLMPPPPKFVFSEGTFHLITKEQFPFYTPHQQSVVYFGHSYNPRVPAPMGLLWWQSMNNPSKTKRSNYEKLTASNYRFHYHLANNAVCEFCDLRQAKNMQVPLSKFPVERLGLKYKK
jgi:hypothetical protein